MKLICLLMPEMKRASQSKLPAKILESYHYEPQIYENAMNFPLVPRENCFRAHDCCKMEIHGMESGHEFPMK
jgi:hypothetical protein